MSSRQALELELARLTERYEEQPAGRVFAPLADCHRKLGQLDTALQICLTGLARHPRYSSAQLILGKIFLDRGEDVPAREALEKVLELDGQNLLAIRLLAEVAERLDELDEAIARWRQLVALEHDPELTEERLANLMARRDGVDEAVEADSADRAQTKDPVERPVEEVADEVAEPAAEIKFPEPAETLGDSGQSREIATLTLAGIYAEQGFKAKALEIFRAIAERNPDLPGLGEKIEAIESAMARVERDTVEDLGSSDADADGDGGLEVVATTTAQSDEDEMPDAIPSEPIFSDVPSSADPVGRDASRYRRFGTWLDRVKDED